MSEFDVERQKGGGRRCRVLVADDHQIFRQGLRHLLERAGHDVVGEAANGREALQMARQLHPEVAVLDLSMPQQSGPDAARELKRRMPDVLCIILTMYAEKAYVVQALRSGVKGYVLKTQAAEDLIRAIDEVLQGRVYLSPSIAGTVVNACLDDSEALIDPLTPRERQVLMLVAEGNTTREIAEQLCISVKTVEAHRGHVMDKLNIHETASLVRYAIRNGLLPP